jgi:hypothetical protein
MNCRAIRPNQSGLPSFFFNFTKIKIKMLYTRSVRYCLHQRLHWPLSGEFPVAKKNFLSYCKVYMEINSSLNDIFKNFPIKGTFLISLIF